MNTRTKVLFVYPQPYDSEEYGIESLWAKKEGDYYRLDNIPFFAKNVALGDLVSVEDDDGALYFDELVEPSGHSTIQLVILNNESAIEVGDEFVAQGCSWEGSHLPKLIAIDVPGDTSYSSIKGYLDEGEQAGRWEYREACLAHD